MQKIFSSSPFDHDVEKATSEMNTSEDWETILQICDNVKEKPNGAKDCLRAITKRLNSNVPHHAMHALTLLDACINNCDKNFHLAVAARDFETELKKLLKKGHPKVVQKLKILLQKWTEEVFKKDIPEFSLIPALYNSVKNEKSEKDCSTSGDTVATSKPKLASNMTTQEKEDDDLAKAIELSLKESSSGLQSSSLYPTASVNSQSTKAVKEFRQVKALYDFEAAEENELTFKMGDIVFVHDDSDANWWKGTTPHCNSREGLFPANFVSADLTTETTPEPPKTDKKNVQFNEQVTVKKILIEEVEINEEKINEMLHMLHEADPTAQTGSDELLHLEDSCFAMAPLIEEKLEDVDRRSASLTASNQQLVDALHFYQSLMKDYNSYSIPDVMHFPPVQAQHLSQIYGAPSPMQTNYLPDSYQQLTTPNSERFQAPLAPSGAVPTSIQPCMMHSASHPHINYGRTNENFASIPQTTLTMSSGNFSAPLPSRDQNIFYGDMGVTSMPPSSAPLSLPQQPMS